MGKQVVYTKVTALPSNVPRQLALDLLHNHEEFARLNNLVTDVKSIEAPRNAAADEYFSDWLEITENISWGFGMKKKIVFKGCFHDQPWGMQSHTWMPKLFEMRNTYRIGGNMPGEPRETRELGLDTPTDGLYLREDINIMCHVPLTAGFVKKEMMEASGVMINRMKVKAELLDAGKLHAMFNPQTGKMSTAKPGFDPTTQDRPLPSPGSPPGSPPPLGSPDFRRAETGFQNQKSPNIDASGYGRYHDVNRNSSVRNSSYIPEYQQTGYNGPQFQQHGAELPAEYPKGPQQGFVNELPGSYYHSQSNVPQALKPGGQSFTAELPGDSSLQPPPAQHDRKPTPPNSTHPAYQQRSPQRSPRLPDTGDRATLPSRAASNGGYQVTNPDGPPPTTRQDSEHSIQQWQQSVKNDAPIDGNYYRNSRHSHSGSQGQVEPDHQRFSNLSVSQSASEGAANPNSTVRTSKCPVCELFEGDDIAVSHHVTKAHFK